MAACSDAVWSHFTQPCQQSLACCPHTSSSPRDGCNAGIYLLSVHCTHLIPASHLPHCCSSSQHSEQASLAQTITEQKYQFYPPKRSPEELEQSLIECSELCLSSGSALPLTERGNGLETVFFSLYFFSPPSQMSKA